MKRLTVTPDQLSNLVNVQYVDVLLPLSVTTGNTKSNGDLNSFNLIYQVDFYNRATPRHLQVFGYRDGAPILDVKWVARKDKTPTIDVLVDNTVEVDA